MIIDNNTDAAPCPGSSRLADAYEEFGTSVWFGAREIVGASVATTITEEVFIDFWRHPERHDRSVPLGRWLVSSAQERADRWQQQRSTVEITSPASQPLSTMARDVAVCSVLGMLTPQQRDVVVLAQYDGKTISQIAAQLDVEPKTVAARIRAGLQAASAIIASGHAERA